MRVNKDLKRTSILILESSHTFSHSPLAQTAASLSQRAISSHSPEKKKQNIRFLQGISGITWAVGKTSIEKCDLRVKVIVFGSSLYRFTVYPDCIICIPLANCARKAFLHLHFSVWSMFDYPALSFAALQLYGMLWYLSMQLQITVAPSFLKFRKQVWIQLLEDLDELSQRHAPCLSFTPQRLGSKPSPWSNAFALATFI